MQSISCGAAVLKLSVDCIWSVRPFMVSQTMLYGLQEICRTTFNSGFNSITGRNADYFAPERSFDS